MVHEKVIQRKSIKSHDFTIKRRFNEKTKDKINGKPSFAKLDKIFSLYIRQRDADKDGIIHCISCGKPYRWQDSDCGHYIGRQHKATRYDEINCNAQCRHENRFEEGNKVGYREGLIAKYGEKAVEQLEMKRFNTAKFTQFEIGLLIKIYQEKNKQFKEL